MGHILLKKIHYQQPGLHYCCGYCCICSTLWEGCVYQADKISIMRTPERDWHAVRGTYNKSGNFCHGCMKKRNILHVYAKRGIFFMCARKRGIFVMDVRKGEILFIEVRKGETYLMSVRKMGIFFME